MQPQPIKSYSEIIRLQKEHQTLEKKAKIAYSKLQLKEKKLKTGIFDQRRSIKIEADPLAKKLESAYEKISLQTRKVYEELEQLKHTGIIILRDLNEKQISFYGNNYKQTLRNSARNTCKIKAENSGEELYFTLREFLSNNPKGNDGKDIGPENAPFIIQGKSGLYSILLDRKGTIIFKDLTIKDIKELIKL